ncbi:MAG: hypothetical protein ACRC7N_04535 [Clostridium sp.]
MKVRHCFFNLSRNILKSLLFMTVIVIASYTIISGIPLFSSYIESNRLINEALKEKVYGVESVSTLEVVKNKYDEDICKDIIENFENTNSFYYLDDQLFLFNEFPGSENFKKVELNESVYVDKITLSINENTFIKNNIKVSEGRAFEKEELKVRKYVEGDIIPVILGSNHRKNFSISDQVELLNGDQQRIRGTVIGFLENGSSIIDYNKEREITLDDYVLTTYSINPNYNNVLSSMLRRRGIIKESEGIESTSKKLNHLSEYVWKQLNIEMGFRDITNETIEGILYVKRVNEIGIVSMGIVIVLSILVLSLIGINSLKKRNKEFSIHILSGGTRLSIYKAIIIEQIILTIPAFILPIWYIKNVEGIVVMNRDIIISILIIIINILVISLIIIRNISKTAISCMVKED